MDKNKAENANFLNDGDEEETTSVGSSVDELPIDNSTDEIDPLVFNVMEMHFSVGEIFWTMSSGKKISLFHPGDWIRKDYLRKFIDAGKEIQIEPIVNDEFCSKGLMLFKKLMETEEEKEKADIREEIITWLSVGFWNGEEEVGLLDLVFVCEQSFYSFTTEEEQRLFDASGDLFKRSSAVGGLLVMLAIVLGYMDKDLLRDLYHLCFLFDISLDESVLSTNLINALEHERLSPQSWHDALEDSEVDTFKTHSNEGVEKAFSLYEERISNPGLLHFIETHHERVNGQGFPLGLQESEISDLEGLIIFVNNRFPYSNMEMKSGDAKAFLRILMEKSEHVEAVLTNRIKKMITNEFENRESEHAKFLEVSGL